MPLYAFENVHQRVACFHHCTTLKIVNEIPLLHGQQEQPGRSRNLPDWVAQYFVHLYQHVEYEVEPNERWIGIA